MNPKRFAVVVAILASACGSPEGMYIDGLPGVMMLGNVAVESGPPPTATSSGNEPVILSVKLENSGDQSFNITVTHTGKYPIKRLHMEINGKRYVSTLEGSGDDLASAIDACEIIAKQQGISCTTECVKACSCVSCPSDANQERLLEQNCAAVCSINVKQGNIGPGKMPYTSEAVYADYSFNGYTTGGTRLPGLLDSFPQCSASECKTVAAAEKKALIKFNVQDWNWVPDLQVGNLVAISEPPAGGPAVSQPFAAAMISSSPCPANTICDGPPR